MKLNTKVTLYSAGITFLVGLLIIAYFIFMLPGLFIDYQEQQFVDSVFSFLNRSEDGLCQDSKQSPMLAYLTIRIPKGDEPVMSICNAYFYTEAVLQDATLIDLYNQIKLIDSDTADSFSITDEQMSALHKLTETVNMGEIITFKNFSYNEDNQFTDTASASKVYSSQDRYVFSTNTDTRSNRFSNYVGLRLEEETTTVVLASTMTSQLVELQPIIYQSLPTILLFLLIFSVFMARFFSRTLVGPITALAHHAQRMKESENTVELIALHRHDEFLVLEQSLNDLYSSLKTAMQRQEQSAVRIQEDKKKQELYLMYSSHQLKTPLAVAMLLVESMINKVGKYKETESYLPEVMNSLHAMQNITYDMLAYLKTFNEEQVMTPVDVCSLMGKVCRSYAILAHEKHCEFKIISEPVVIETDEKMLLIILDNLWSNAVKHAKDNTVIEGQLTRNQLIIRNESNTKLPVDLYKTYEAKNPHPERAGASHGFGLMLIIRYSELLNLPFAFTNDDQSVTITLGLQKEIENVNHS